MKQVASASKYKCPDCGVGVMLRGPRRVQHSPPNPACSNTTRFQARGEAERIRATALNDAARRNKPR